MSYSFLLRKSKMSQEQKTVTRIKICCISSIEEAKMAIDIGAHAIGLVANMPSGPGVISEDLIAKIARYAPPAITSVLLTSNRSIEDITTQHQFCRTNAIQICDSLLDGTHEELRKSLPGISLIQVIHVTGQESLEEAINVAPHADALLLDSGKKSDGMVELGGTGRTHDWAISEQEYYAIRKYIIDNPKNWNSEN